MNELKNAAKNNEIKSLKCEIISFICIIQHSLLTTQNLLDSKIFKFFFFFSVNNLNKNFFKKSEINGID